MCGLYVNGNGAGHTFEFEEGEKRILREAFY